MNSHGKTIGILGGMGPAATVELFSRIVKKTPAKVDSEHVKLIIINDPTIPDRTNYILEKDDSPIPKLLENLNRLHLSGAELAVMPCMTAHAFIDELQSKSPIPIINAIELVEGYLRLHPDIQKVGLLATTGSVVSGAYQKYITKNLIIPDEERQQDVMHVIYKIKAGDYGEEINKCTDEVVSELVEKGAQAVIAGCTELGIIMNENRLKIKVIDPINLLVEEVVKYGQLGLSKG